MQLTKWPHHKTGKLCVAVKLEIKNYANTENGVIKFSISSNAVATTWRLIWAPVVFFQLSFAICFKPIQACYAENKLKIVETSEQAPSNLTISKFRVASSWNLLVWLTDLHSTWKGIFELSKLSSGWKSHGRENSVTTVATVVESCHSMHPSSLRGSHFLAILLLLLSNCRLHTLFLEAICPSWRRV